MCIELVNKSQLMTQQAKQKAEQGTSLHRQFIR